MKRDRQRKKGELHFQINNMTDMTINRLIYEKKRNIYKNKTTEAYT